MRRLLGILCFSLLGARAARPAEFQVSAADWAIEAAFAAQPKTDLVLSPSPQGDVKASRYIYEPPGEHYLLIKFTYPMALLPGDERALYDRSMGELTRSRPGQVQGREPYQLGPYEGQRVLIAQPREKSLRELRMIVIGSSLYVCSAEWPADSAAGAANAGAFFGSFRLRTDYANPRTVEERERYREFGLRNLKLRYDATRWYRDPADADPGIFNLLRTDQKAEAQFICEENPIEGGDIEKAVLDTAREGADSLSVKRRGRKQRGAASVIELEFNATVANVTYVNHGYFYTGPEGAVQLRGWAREQEYRGVAADIGELLDGLGLTISPAGVALTGTR
ncbi:MAG: hypothetical protein HYV75_09145 [Opitutae bacterium]|nr:hypothetical protein [Opitutae bacterium]